MVTNHGECDEMVRKIYITINTFHEYEGGIESFRH
jgi:hypothetical protein